jgi:predicted exporter
MNNQYNEEAKVNNDSSESEGEYVYKTVIKNKENRRTWSVVSLALAVLSLLSLFVSWLSLTFGVLAVGAGVFSGKNLGYFDKISISGIIVGIFGCVFAIAIMLFGEVFSMLF